MVFIASSAPPSTSAFSLSTPPPSSSSGPPVPPPPHPARPNHRKRISRWSQFVSTSTPAPSQTQRLSVNYYDTLNARSVQAKINTDGSLSTDATNSSNPTNFDPPTMSSLLRKRRAGKDQNSSPFGSILRSQSASHLPLPDSFVLPLPKPKSKAKLKRPSTSHGESSTSRPSNDESRATSHPAMPLGKATSTTGNGRSSLLHKMARQRSLGNLLHHGRSSYESSDSTATTNTPLSSTFSRPGHSPQSSISSVMDGGAPQSRSVGKRWSREASRDDAGGVDDDRSSTFSKRAFFRMGGDGVTRYHPYSDYNVPYPLPYDDTTLEK